MRPRVFITQPVARSAIERLRSVAEVESNSDAARIMTKDELLAAVREHDILFCLLQDRVDAGVIAANPKLRAIASMKITPSDIDVAAATARRIPVTVIPPMVTEATADLHFGLMLAVARRVVEGDRLLHAGVRRKDGNFASGVIHIWHAEADRSWLSDNERKLAGILASDRIRAQRGLTSLQAVAAPATAVS